MTSDLVTGSHLCRRAVIYIRQSTPHQVITNQESLRLQYALRQRANDLGWEDTNIEVVDADLGLSGYFTKSGQRFRKFPDTSFAKYRTVVSLNRGQSVGVDFRLPCGRVTDS